MAGFYLDDDGILLGLYETGFWAFVEQPIVGVSELLQHVEGDTIHF